MMKRPNKTQTSQSSVEHNGLQNSAGSQQDTLKSSSKNQELMSRLAKGEKAEVSKKDMLKLTNKNYEMLPEVRKKKEEERKKEEMRDRLRQVKELEKQRRELISTAGSGSRGSSRRQNQ